MGAVGKGCCDDEYAVLGVGCARMGGGVSMWGLSGAVDCEAGFDAVGVLCPFAALEESRKGVP